jgi:hypothetical protein
MAGGIISGVEPSSYLTICSHRLEKSDINTEQSQDDALFLRFKWANVDPHVQIFCVLHFREAEIATDNDAT